MKIFLFSICLVISLCSCKDAVGGSDTLIQDEVPLTTPEKIAMNYGLEAWKNVSELQFTFNVDRKDQHFERSFIWNLKSDEIIYIKDGDTITYNRKNNLDSLALVADKRFINDSYWLLSPFKLVWDEGVSFSEMKQAIAPISKDTLNKLTILYNGEVGYTPGDAYDFYYDNDYMIKEWAYRGGNSENASTVTSWSDIQSFGQIKLATRHQDATGDFKLYFTHISIK